MTQTVKDLDLTPPDFPFDDENVIFEIQNWLARNFGVLKANLVDGVGVTGTFTTVDSKTITVTDGIITGIV